MIACDCVRVWWLVFAAKYFCTQSAVAANEATDIWHQDLGSIRISPLFERQVNGTKPTKRADSLNSTGKDDKDSSTRIKVMSSGKLSAKNSSASKCDFGGQHVRVAVSPQPPFVDCLQNLYGEWLCNGSNIEVIRVLEGRLNFRADWIVLASHYHHYQDGQPLGKGSSPSMAQTKRASNNAINKNLNETLKSSAIFGLVATGRALLGANGVMKTLDRQHEKLLVSEPFDSFQLHFLLSKSVRDHDHIFVKPFTLNAWLAIFGSACLVVPIFYLINTTSLHYSIHDDKHLKRISAWHCLKHLVRTKLGLICSQSQSRTGRRRRRGSSSSDDSSLDMHISQMVESNEDRPEFMANQYHLPGGSGGGGGVGGLVRGERKRRRRLIKRQWRLERRRAKKLGRQARQSGFFKVAYIVWYVVASLANQGGETEDLPHASSTRILVAFWWLYLIVICAIHSGILTAILTFPKQIDFIQTLDDYLNLEPGERAEIKLAVDKHSELAHLLADPNNLHKSALQALQDQSVPVLYVDFNRHRQRILDDVQQGHSAFMEEKSIITQIISQEYFDSRETKCLFKASRFPVDVIPMSLIMSVQMPAECVASINSILSRIMTTGLAQKWRRKFDSMGNDCLNSVVINAGDVDKIEFKHVVLAFWLLLTGVAIGLLFLIGEIVWLFMTEYEDEEEEEEDDDDDSDHSTSTCSSSSSTSSDSHSDASPSAFEAVQLGHRRAVQRPSDKAPIRTMQVRGNMRSMMRHVRRNQKRLATRAPNSVPKIKFSLEDESDVEQDLDIENELRLGPMGARRAVERKKRRAARAAERRAKRIERTMDFLKKVHGGKIYSDKVKSRVRRTSMAIMSHLAAGQRRGRDGGSANHQSSSVIQHQPQTTTTRVRKRSQVERTTAT